MAPSAHISITEVPDPRPQAPEQAKSKFTDRCETAETISVITNAVPNMLHITGSETDSYSGEICTHTET